MHPYTPPIETMVFLLNHLGFSSEEYDGDTISAILEEAGKLASNVLAPLNFSGDQGGAVLKDGAVTTAKGFKEAYKEYAEGGWNSVPFEPEYGGQGMPWALAFPIQEMWQAANMSFGLCPLLNQGATEAILHHGSEEQKAYYLPRMISGEWTGTMNLTEPQAGSDLGLIRTKASKQDDGSYKISGQKIFITYGEHDLTDNIIHLVLARCDDAPEDVKGISLFIVPKILESGERNAATCIGIEHKLGIHASPTCTMEFDGATGYLVGEENQGLKYMFTMMNNARLSVGLQGVAVADRAYQAARGYADERVQGKSFSSHDRVSIDKHPDVQNMLMEMQALTLAGRALTYEAAIALDKPEERWKVDFLTPVVKAWCTDRAVDVASIGIQVHGGMGYVEETGAAQYLRDARILPIYEGTNGIQAADLVFRKMVRDEGQGARQYLNSARAKVLGDFDGLFEDIQKIIDKVVDLGQQQALDKIAHASSDILEGFGYVFGGAHMTSFLDNPDATDETKKLVTFYIKHILPRAQGYLKSALNYLED